MKNLLKFSFYFTISSVFLLLACSPEEVNISDSNGSSSLKVTSKEQFNHEQAGNLAYTHIKYYAVTVDPINYLSKDQREEFRKEFDELYTKMKSDNWGLKESLAYMIEKKAYSQEQADIINNQYLDLCKLFENRPTQELVWDYCLKQEQEIIDNERLTYNEKESLLAHKSIVRYMLKYKMETMPESAKPQKGARMEASQLNCGFWEQLSCWVGAVTGVSGVSGLLGNFVSGKTFNVIGAAIGAAIGVVQGFSQCQCQNEGVCQPFTGVSFPYNCYSAGDPIQVTGWGYGNVAPSQYTWEYYKNGNVCNGCNFYTTFSSVNYTYLMGNTIADNSVSSFAIMTKNYCDNQWKESQYFGWYYLSDLGKPFLSIQGRSSFTSSEVSYNQTGYTYEALGPIQFSPNTTILWEIIPSGYPGYSASGYFTGNNNLTYCNIRWNSTPGMATVKCTAISPCATVVQYFNVHIQ